MRSQVKLIRGLLFIFMVLDIIIHGYHIHKIYFGLSVINNNLSLPKSLKKILREQKYRCVCDDE